MAELAVVEKIGVIVVGLPRNMNGTEARGGESAGVRRTTARREAAKSPGDERLTTVAAQKPCTPAAGT